MADAWANSMACHPTATCHIAGCCHLENLMSWSQSYVSHCRMMPPANSTACHPRATYQIAGCCHMVNSLSWFQSHMPHCRCSHLAKSMSWSCHIAGCNNSIRHIENHFSPYFIFFCFWCSFGFVERRLLYRLQCTCLSKHMQSNDNICLHFTAVIVVFCCVSVIMLCLLQ